MTLVNTLAEFWQKNPQSTALIPAALKLPVHFLYEDGYYHFKGISSKKQFLIIQDYGH